MEPDSQRPLGRAMLHGWRQTCPACGNGPAVVRWLRIPDRCSACGTEFAHHRADDAPASLAMLATGVLVTPALALVEWSLRPPLWIHFLAWPTAGVLLVLILLPRFKGLVLALQWALRMHGFGAERKPGAPLPGERDCFRR